MRLLEISSLSKTYHPRRRRKRPKGIPKKHGSSDNSINALLDINLSIGEGQSLGIVGESGAGKSTLAMIACGLTRPSSGSITLAGRPLDALDRRHRAGILQMIWQDAAGSLDPLMTIGASVGEPLKIHGFGGAAQIEKKVEELLGEVGLKPALDHRYPHELSGGELQRVVIARALALEPRLLICDEPASALDVRIKSQVAGLLMRLRQERGLACVIIAHDLMLIRGMTEELAVMFAGSIVEKGPTREVLRRPLHPYTRMLIASESPSIPANATTSDGARTNEPHPDRWTDPKTNGTGCPFFLRCDQVIERCRREPPKLVSAGEGREVACSLLRNSG